MKLWWLGFLREIRWTLEDYRLVASCVVSLAFVGVFLALCVGAALVLRVPDWLVR